MTINRDELVNPERCEECGQSAVWWITEGSNFDFISFYSCDNCLPVNYRYAKPSVAGRDLKGLLLLETLWLEWPGHGVIGLPVEHIGPDADGVECAFVQLDGCVGAEALTDIVQHAGRWTVKGTDLTAVKE